MWSEHSRAIKDDGFDSVSLEDRTCDICFEDTGEPLSPCSICLKSYFDTATSGFHVLPEVIHKGQKGHKECWKKSHEVLAGNISVDCSYSSASSNPRLSGGQSFNLVRKSFSENLSDFAAEIQSRVAENILWIFRRNCVESRIQNQTLTHSEGVSSPQWARREFSDTSRLSASMTNLSADLTDARTCRKLDSADFNHSRRQTSEGWPSKTDDKILDSNTKSSNEVLKRRDSWNRVKPVKKRNIVITVTDGDIDLKDIVEYSPKDFDNSDEMLTFKAENMTNGENEKSRQQSGHRGERQLSISNHEGLDEEKKFPTYSKNESISSKLVDLVQERHFLREEVDVRHIFIEKLLKLNLSSDPL